MLVQRLCTMADLPEIERLASSSPVGVTALPTERQRLADIIEASMASMAEEVVFSGEERYLFVLEDKVSGRLAGCSSVVAAAGFSQPFYSFRNETFVHASAELGLHNRIHVLSLCHDLTSHSLLTGFHLEPAARAQSTARVLNTLGRLLFMANHPQRFAESTAAEIVGICDGEGNAPFWDAVGRYFFAVSYSEAEQIGSSRGRNFLAELMPGYPIYVPMLSDEAQEVIGEVHPSAQAVFDILMREGFETDNYVDIFDGGPVIHARTAALRSLSTSQVVQVEIGQPKPADGLWLAANDKVADYRACALRLAHHADTPLVLSPEQADLLQVTAGDTLRLVREA